MNHPLIGTTNSDALRRIISTSTRSNVPPGSDFCADGVRSLMNAYHVTEQHFVRDIESRPCACGDRETSQPQRLLTCEATEDRGPAVCVLRIRGKFECGVCKQVHDGLMRTEMSTMMRDERR